MDDPCVKYDLERKLWIYLHKDRQEDYPDWQDGDENLKLESSKTKKKKNKYGVETVISIPRGSLFD